MSDVSPALAAFLDEPLVAVIGTRRGGGRVALTAVWFEYRERQLWLNSFESAAGLVECSAPERRPCW